MDLRRYFISLAVTLLAACTFSLASTSLSFAQTKFFDEGGKTPFAFSCPAFGVSRIVDLCIQNNPGLMALAAEKEQARHSARETRARVWPQLGVYTEYGRGDSPSAYLFRRIDQRKLPPGVDFNDPGFFHNFETGLGASMTLFRSWGGVLERKSASFSRDRSVLNYRAAENRLVMSVLDYCYTALSAEGFVRVAERTLDILETQRSVVEARHSGGAAKRSDLLFLSVRTAQAEEDLLIAQNVHATAIAELGAMMGLSPGENFGVIDEKIDFSILPTDYESGRKIALARRLELENSRVGLENARTMRDFEKTSYFPEIKADARYYFDAEEMKYATGRANWMTNINLKWRLFDGGQRKARVDKASAALKEMEARDKSILLMVELEVDRAFRKLAEAASRKELTARSLEHAKENLRLVSRRYEKNAAGITEYLDAQLAMSKSLNRQVAAEYDFLKSKALVAGSIGVLPDMFALPGNSEGKDE